MDNKPKNLEQMGVSLDDILVHNNNNADAQMLKQAIQQEVQRQLSNQPSNVSEEKIKQLVNKAVTESVQLPNKDDVKNIVVNEMSRIPKPLTEFSMKKLIAEEVKRQKLSAHQPTEIPVNENMIKKLVVDEISKLPKLSIVKDAIRKVVNEEVTNSKPTQDKDSGLSEEQISTLIEQKVDKLKQSILTAITETIVNEIQKQLNDNQEEHFSSVDDYKQHAENQIDNHAGTIRSHCITCAPGQDALYAEKIDEATDYVTAGYPDDLSDYPLLRVEVETLNKSIDEVIEKIFTKKSDWIRVSTQTERIRLKAKRDVRKCSTFEQVDEITNEALSELNNIS